MSKISFTNGLIGTTAITNAGIGRSLSEVATATRKWLEGAGAALAANKASIDVVEVGDAAANVLMSTMVLIGKVADGQSFAYLVALGVPARSIAPRSIPTPTGNLSLPLSPEDAVDAVYTTAVRNYLTKVGKQVADVVGTVIWSEKIKPADPDLFGNALNQAINGLLAVAADPAGTAEHLDLSKLDSTEQIVATVSTGVQTTIDGSGEPRWQQIGVSVAAVPTANQGSSLNTRSAMPIAEVGLTVDFLRNSRTAAPQVPGGMPTVTHYVPRILVSIQSVYGMELEQALMALAMSSAGAANHYWATATLNPTALYDAGWLAAEFDGKVDIGGATMDALSIKRFLAGLVDMTSYITTLRVGRSTAIDNLLSVFVEASKGDARSQAAILAAANRLVGGRLNWDGQPVLVTGNSATGSLDVTPRGQFSRGGEVHDLAELNNTLGISGLTSGAQAAMQRYLPLRQDMNMPAVVRVSQLSELITNMAGTTAVTVTGIDRLVTITGGFLDALVKGVQASGAGLRVVAQNPFTAGVVDYNTSYLANGMGAFNAGLTAQQTAFNPGNGAGRAW